MIDVERVVAFARREGVRGEKVGDREARHAMANVIFLKDCDRSRVLGDVVLAEETEVHTAHANRGERPEKGRSGCVHAMNLQSNRQDWKLLQSICIILRALGKAGAFCIVPRCSSMNAR